MNSIKSIIVAPLAVAALAISGFSVGQAVAGPNGKTLAQKQAIEAQRQAAAAAANPHEAAVRAAQKYPSPHGVNEFSTDELKYILRVLGGNPFLSANGQQAIVASDSGPTLQQRVNDAYLQGGMGIGPNTQPGAPASTFDVCGYPNSGPGCYTPSANALKFVREYQAYQENVAVAKEAANKQSDFCTNALAAGKDGKRVQRKCGAPAPAAAPAAAATK